MLAQLVSLLGLLAFPSAESECRAFPIDYDVAECDGLDAHLARVPHTWVDGAPIPASEECNQW